MATSRPRRRRAPAVPGRPARLLRRVRGRHGPALTPVPAAISDDAIRESIEPNQLRLAGERGTDLTIFSPQASATGHHVTDPATAHAWARACNDLIGRVITLFPRNFAGVCQLPHVTAWPLDDCVTELDRCVRELGFVGCNLNPDPSGGYWTSPPLTDVYWFPLYEKMTELDVPAHDPRLGLLQPGRADYRRALPQRRHDRVHAARRGRPVRPVPVPAVRDPARRRRGALPLGPVPWPGRAAGAAAAGPAPDAATSSSTPASTTSRASTC